MVHQAIDYRLPTKLPTVAMSARRRPNQRPRDSLHRFEHDVGIPSMHLHRAAYRIRHVVLRHGHAPAGRRGQSDHVLGSRMFGQRRRTCGAVCANSSIVNDLRRAVGCRSSSNER